MVTFKENRIYSNGENGFQLFHDGKMIKVYFNDKGSYVNIKGQRKYVEIETLAHFI